MKQFSTSRNSLPFFSKRGATSIISKKNRRQYKFFPSSRRRREKKKKSYFRVLYPLRIQKGSERRRFTLISRNEGPLGRGRGARKDPWRDAIKMERASAERARGRRPRKMRNAWERGSQLTVVGVVEVDDFLPSVISHCVDDSAMIIRTHAYGEIQETGGRCQNL